LLDLLLIKNLWKQLKAIISKRRHKIKNVRIIERAIAELWHTIKKERLLNLNASIPRQLNACLKNKGKATKY
jgi:hypothetical protein